MTQAKNDAVYTEPVNGNDSATGVNLSDNKGIEFPTAEPKKEYDLSKDGGWKMFADKLSTEDVQAEITKYLTKLRSEYKFDNYNILILFDEYTSLGNYEADKIYQAINKFTEKKDILLVVNNHGGSIESAYLMSKTCKKSSDKKFIVAVPRKAKSAATLLSLGADEIHMGLLSQLGPIDPQIEGLPALGLGNSLEYIARIVTQHPKSATMFSNYLSSKLELNTLGYFERVSESATQYAERLLGAKKLPQNETMETISKKFVYHYKDHKFVIDIDEALKLLGEDIIKENSKEYQFANEIYSVFNNISFAAGFIAKKNFTYVGNITQGLTFFNKE